jgi:hypothetical protein
VPRPVRQWELVRRRRAEHWHRHGLHGRLVRFHLGRTADDKLEGKRILFHHMNDMLDPLGAHEKDEDEEIHQTAVVAE